MVDIVFLFIGGLIAYILLKFNYNDILTILLAFLPVLLNLIYNNCEKIKLFIASFRLRYRQVSLVLRVKNTFELKTDKVIEVNELEKYLIKKLVEKGVIVGKENNKLRIERQTLKNGKDNNIQVRIPITIFLQLNDNVLYSHMENTMDPIVYKNIPEWVNEVEMVWDFVIDHIKDLTHGELKYTVYNAKIVINEESFKNVYLAKYAPKYINKLELNKENSLISVTDDILEIQSKSFKDFKKEINTYCSLAKSFFKK